jgi:phosphoenolpyruvate-protein kinase (PTS system EI component)
MKLKYQQLIRLATTIATALVLSASVLAQSRAALPTETVSQSRASLIEASGAYRESLERVLELQRQDEARAAELVEKRKALLDPGSISRREPEATEQALAAAQARMSATHRQIESDNFRRNGNLPSWPAQKLRRTGSRAWH